MTNPTALVPVRLPNGAVVRMEARRLGGPEKVGAVLEALPVDDLVAAAEGVALAVYEALREVSPQKATVTLGLEVGVEAGKLVALFCQGSATANLSIALEWADGE